MTKHAGLPSWWGNAQKMEALVRARPQYSSDAKALRACGVKSNNGLYAVLAWGRGTWKPERADPLETGLAETFTLLWEEARERAPKMRRPDRWRKRIGAAALENLQTRLNRIGSEWDLGDIGGQRRAEEPNDA